jgi:hypothetical protein
MAIAASFDVLIIDFLPDDERDLIYADAIKSELRFFVLICSFCAQLSATVGRGRGRDNGDLQLEKLCNLVCPKKRRVALRGYASIRSTH